MGKRIMAALGGLIMGIAVAVGASRVEKYLFPPERPLTPIEGLAKHFQQTMEDASRDGAHPWGWGP